MIILYRPSNTQSLNTVTGIPILMVASRQPALRLLKWRLMQGPRGVPTASLNYRYSNEEMEHQYLKGNPVKKILEYQSN